LFTYLILLLFQTDVDFTSLVTSLLFVNMKFIEEDKILIRSCMNWGGILLVS